MGAPTKSSRIVAGRYRLVRELGAGGMGTVWLAADQLLDREVAVKEVSPPADVTVRERAALRERTLREARTAARLSHPNVVTIYDVVEDGGRPWIVMELVAARSLRDIVAEDGPLSAQHAAEIGIQLLAALGAAHALGIMHRDVKPGNVLIDAGGRAVLADFGIARTQDSPTLTTSGVLVGSPSYIAPERARGEPGGPESDLWSLGATLYAAVEGRPPYDRNGALATLTAVVTEEPDAPRRCGMLWPVISGLLARDPGQRPGPAETGEMLRQVAGDGPGLRAAGPGPGPAAAAEPAAAAAPEAAGRSAAGPASTLQDAERTLAFHPQAPLLPPDRDDGQEPQDGPGYPRGRDGEPVPAPAGPEPAPEAAWRAGLEPAPPEEPPAAATPPPVRPRTDPRPPAESGTAPMGRPPRRHWRRRAGLVGGLLAAAAAVGVFAAVDTLGHHQAQTQAPSGSQHSSTAPSRPAGRPSATASTPPPAATPTAGSGGAGLAPAPGTGAGSSAPIPAGFHRYQDPTGFSIAMPDGWGVSHQGHYAYLTPPSGAEFLLIDQSSHPQPNPLADWRQQEANRESTYPGYHRIRLVAIRYPQAEKAADWEFTYDRQGVLTHVLNRNILANSAHAYALYWSTPQAEWGASWHIFQILARTFQPAP